MLLNFEFSLKTNEKVKITRAYGLNNVIKPDIPVRVTRVDYSAL